MSYGDRSKLTQNVTEVLRDIEDWRSVAWLVDDMINRKPSSLDEILQARESKIAKKHSFAKRVSDYSQPVIVPKKTKNQNHSHDNSL